MVCSVILATGVGTACAEVGLGPNEAAAIELDPFPSPSVVVGDTLRNIDGVVTAVRARVFNVRGDVINDAAPRYLYADFNIDWSTRAARAKIDKAKQAAVDLQTNPGILTSGSGSGSVVSFVHRLVERLSKSRLSFSERYSNRRRSFQRPRASSTDFGRGASFRFSRIRTSRSNSNTIHHCSRRRMRRAC
jgi:hypothetical protein